MRFSCRTVRCDPCSSSLPTSPLSPPNQSPFFTLVLLLPCFLSVEKADRTPLSSSDQVVVTTTATEILKSTLHTIAQPSGLKYGALLRYGACTFASANVCRGGLMSGCPSDRVSPGFRGPIASQVQLHLASPAKATATHWHIVRRGTEGKGCYVSSCFGGAARISAL